MGKLETGTYALLSDSTYQFNASKGYSYAVELIPLSDYQLILSRTVGNCNFQKSVPTLKLKLQKTPWRILWHINRCHRADW